MSVVDDDVAAAAAADNCWLCERVLLEADRKMEYECGCHTVHTACGLTRAYVDILNGGQFRCHTCETVFVHGGGVDNYTGAESVAEDDGILTTLRKNKAFKADLRALRARRAAKTKAFSAFMKKVKEEYVKFNTATEISIQSIKLSQNETRRLIKQSEEYKAIKKADTGFTISTARFKTKYNLGYRDMRALKLEQRRRWWYRRHMPNRILEWKFRVRIL
jgi:hypothetical protein